MLANANILVPSDYEESQIAEWKQTCSNLFIQQQSEQYAIVRGIIHPLQIAALRRYFRTLDHKNFLLPDTQGASLRYAWHNEKVAQFIHHQLSNLVKQITRQPIKPLVLLSVTV